MFGPVWVFKGISIQKKGKKRIMKHFQMYSNKKKTIKHKNYAVPQFTRMDQNETEYYTGLNVL